MLGAEPGSSHMCFLFWRRADWMFIVLSVALGAAYTIPQPPQHLQTIPNFISTKGPSVGLNFRRPAQLCRQLCELFKEKAILCVRLLRGIKLCRVVNLTVTHRILKLFRAEAFITPCERLARSASGIDVWSVAFSFYKWEALSIHLILCKAYFSLDSLVRAE